MSDPDVSKEQMELEILKAELEIKQLELKDKKKSWWRKINPTLGAAIIAAFVAFFGNLFVECSRNSALLELENKKRESSLIIEAAKPGDPAIFRNRAKFYIDVGLIEDENIIKYIQEKDEGVFLTLFKMEPSGIIISYLLKYWEADDEFKEFKFKIREGIKSKQGLDVDADMLKNIIKENSNLIEGFESIEVIDRLTLKIRLSKPNIDFISQLLVIGIIAKEDLWQ
jgi:ABC-type transport system substrate-binding protein